MICVYYDSNKHHVANMTSFQYFTKHQNNNLNSDYE